MELRHLRYFVAVAEERNFARAARRLQLAQPPLSQQIQQLEREFGVELFDRSKRPVELTSAGTILLEDARRLLARADDTARAMTHAAHGEVGQLKIGCVPSAFFGVAPIILQAYRRRYPAVRLFVSEENTAPLVQELVTGQTDVGLLRAIPHAKGLKTQVLYREPLVAAIPETHQLSQAPAVSLNDLADDRFIMFPREFARENFDLVTHACAIAGFSPEILLQRGAYHMQTGYVACNLGVALVPESLQCLKPPGVTYKPLSPPAPSVDTTVAWGDSSVNPLRDRFIDLAQHLYEQGVRFPS